MLQSYGGARRFLGETSDQKLSIAKTYQAGFFAGFCVSFVEGPVDLFKTQLQIRGDQYRGFFNCAGSILKEFGIRGAFQGIVPTMLRNSFANGAWYATYEFLSRAQLKEGQKKADLATWQVLISGGLAGNAYWLAVYPMDVIKTTIQSDHPDPSNRKFSGIINAAKHVKASGRLFRGLLPCLLRSSIASGATFVAYEQASKALDSI